MLISALPKLTREALDEILQELNRAQLLYKTWPTDKVYVAAIVAEEAGEALQAALNLRAEDPHSATTTAADYRKELVQTAAMALRALINLPA